MSIKKQSKEMNPVRDRLISWGLNKVESEIYLYLLQKSIESGGTKIALGTGVHRQYVYVALEGLINKSLVEVVGVGKYKKYKAKGAQQFEKIMRRKSIETNDLVQELNKISAIHNDQDFEVLQGAEAIRQYEMNYAYDCEEGEEEFIIGGYSEGFSKVMGDSLEEYMHQKSKKKIKIYYIGSDSERETYGVHVDILEKQELRFLKELPQGTAHMLIRKGSVSFYSFLTPPLLYIVKSSVVAEHYKQFFMMLWNMTKE